MMFTSEMVHLTAVVLKSRADEVSRALLGAGAVEFSRLADIEPEMSSRLHGASVDEKRVSLTETRLRIEKLLQIGGTETPAVVGLGDESASVSVEAVNSRIDQLTRDAEKFRNRQAEIQREINRITDVRRQLAELASQGGAGPFSGVTESSRGAHRYLDIRYGRIQAGSLARAEGEISRYSGIVIDVEKTGVERGIFVISMKRNSVEVERVLTESGFQRQEIPRLPEGIDALGEADTKLNQLVAEQAEQGAHVTELIARNRPELEQTWREIRVVELMLTIRGESVESEHATVFSGWVPRRRQQQVETVVQQASEGACHLEWHDVREIQEVGGSRVRVPVELRNPGFLGPFQMLVTNFGVPAYGTIDPTPVVAVAYLLMFGLMFGDAGHGLVLVLLGLIGQRVFSSPGYRQLSRLIVWCGAASIVMGVLFGAYFGLELFPPLWFDYHAVVAGHAEAGAVANIMDILTLTVFFGIAVIGVGLILNWVNRIRKREWLELLFAKEGILGGLIYATGVWIARAFAASGFRSLPDLRIAGLLILVPSILLFLKFPIEASRNPGHHGSPAMWVMNWVIELLEVFAGYLANTLSFMRVAGLGIAHVMLMVAFFQIADMISPGGASVVSIIVLVFGNVLVIALEGLSAGIQSLRLNYYEFFSKYFVATGSAYRPISLKNTSEGG